VSLELQLVARLFKVEVKQLQTILTSRSSVTRGEKFITPYSVPQAINTRDACAKAMYGALFKWIVRSINKKIHCASFSNYIGILDIFGFEIFTVILIQSLGPM
jgi:myosin heavy subunit